jgi:hypothetical protein
MALKLLFRVIRECRECQVCQVRPDVRVTRAKKAIAETSVPR